MSQKISILVTSAGRRSQLLECIRKDAQELECDLNLVAADLNPDMSPACQLADEAISVPKLHNAGIHRSTFGNCKEREINLLIPTIDTELKTLASNKSRFSAIGTHISISDHALVNLAQNKLRTAKELNRLGIATPRTAAYKDFNPKDSKWRWPLILKPNSGSNSQGLYRVAAAEDYPKLDSNADYIVQECIQGIEYTINCCFDNNGKLLAAVPHERIEVRGGEVSKGATRRIAKLQEIADKLSTGFSGWHGPICFQAIKSKEDDNYYVFEINARFGGGFPIAHQAGSPFTRWLIQESLGKNPGPISDWKNNLVMLRYESAVFFDD